ncbi:hypothetical protein [Sporisorium scitamineum]|uniref:Reverse transcriptase domain-containing protein n=1 Tax=Sporisorium scitamineum TaxID=49012 RepID=A0A0F7SDU1_9BASI|nr:hypothetical protein [Sporisorium scitamineum]
MGLASFDKWTSAWLTKRSFHIKFEGELSDKFSLGTKGIPQGSPLSHLLWAIYADSIFQEPYLEATPSPLMEGAYVDDIFTVIGSETISALYSDCQPWLDRIIRWAQRRGIGLDKPSFLIANNKRKLIRYKDIISRDELTVRDSARVKAQPIIKVLGNTLGHDLDLTTFIKDKCAKVIKAANHASWTLSKHAEVPPQIRMRIAKSTLYPVLNPAGALHPWWRGGRNTNKEIGLAEKAILTFVLDSRHPRHLPSGDNLAHELGQLSSPFRWRKQALLHFGRVLMNSSHASSETARECLQLVETEDPPGEEASLLDMVGTTSRHKSGTATKTSPLLLAARTFPYDDVEKVVMPRETPNRWQTLKVIIEDRDTAKGTEAKMRGRKDKRLARLYTDGAAVADKLGSAFKAFSFDGSETGEGGAKLDANHWDVMEAELYVIRRGLRIDRHFNISLRGSETRSPA